MEDHLTSEEARVLGALIEKENATPDYYPLTLNSLINACNQKSSRDPVMNLGEREVMVAIDNLRDRQYAWVVHSADSRVPKYEQNFSKTEQLTLQECAVICVLLLRGPQTMGEIRSRTNRIYPFDGMDEVAVALEALMDREDRPLVSRLPLQPGRKEARYAHLLMGVPAPEPEPEWSRQEGSDPPVAPEQPGFSALQERVQQLEQQMEAMKSAFEAFKSQFE